MCDTQGSVSTFQRRFYLCLLLTICRITDDDWNCRRCLNKFAKQSEQPLPPNSQLGVIDSSERLMEVDEISASACTRHSILTDTTQEVPFVLESSLPLALCSEGTEPNGQEAAYRSPVTGTGLDDQRISSDHSPIDVLHFVAGSRHNATLKPENVDYSITKTVKTSAKSTSTDNTSCYRGWQAKIQSHAMRTNSVNGGEDSTPSPAAAPSVVDETMNTSTDPALSVPTNKFPCYVNGSNGDPSIVLQSVDRRPGRTLARHLSNPVEVPAAQLLPLDDAPALSSPITHFPTKDNLAQKISGELFANGDHYSREGPSRNKDQVPMVKLNLRDSPCDTRSATHILDNSKTNRNEISGAMATMTSKTNHETRSSVPSLKKLCSRCRRFILGSTSTCTKCRQAMDGEKCSRFEVNLSKDHANTQDRPTKTTKESLSQKPHFTDGGSSPLLTHENEYSYSPTVPETPELASDKTGESVRVRRDEEAKIGTILERLPKPIHQKRPAISSVVTGNEHCFSKKKPRMYKPVIKPMAIDMTPVSLDKLPPTLKSGSPLIKYNSRDAAVQTIVETGYRGPYLSSAAYEVAHALNVFVNGSTSPDDRRDQTTTWQGEIAAVDSSSRDPGSLRECSDPKLEQRRMGKRSRNSLGQQARTLTNRNQEFEQAGATETQLQRPVRRNGEAPQQHSSAAEAESCKRGSLDDVLNRQINDHDRLIKNARDWNLKDEKALLNGLQSRGVMFEEDTSLEEDVDVPAPQTTPIPKDPLWCCPQSSKDLFLIAPTLRSNLTPFGIEGKREEIAMRPSRKQRRMKVLSPHQKRDNSLHREVKRAFPPQMVKISPIVISKHGDSVSRHSNEMEMEQLSQVEMSFADFIGAPAEVVAILTEDKQLAFQDGRRVVKGDLARKQFIVTNRSIACMES